MRPAARLRLTTLAAMLAIAVASAAQASSEAPPAPAEAILDAVLVQKASDGVVGLDLESATKLRVVLPTTATVSVRATLKDGNGGWMNGETLQGTLWRQGSAPVGLLFAQTNADGIYRSQEIAYPGGAVVFETKVVSTPSNVVNKTYAPLLGVPLP